MVVKKKVTKKRVAKKKVAAKKKVTAVNRQAETIAKLRESLKVAKAEASEAKKQARESDRRTAALLKLLESTKTATDKFLAARTKDAIKKYGAVTKPKKRKRRATKKAVAKK